MLRLPSRELVFMMCGNVWTLRRHRHFSVWCLAECKCQQGAALSLPTAGFCLLVFSSVFCSFSFPFLEISSPVDTVAGIHQEMQFSSLRGNSLWRTLVIASPVLCKPRPPLPDSEEQCQSCRPQKGGVRRGEKRGPTLLANTPLGLIDTDYF